MQSASAAAAAADSGAPHAPGSSAAPATITPAPAIAVVFAAKPKAKRRRVDASLDFFSAEFDAAKALRTPGVTAPLPMPLLDTWEECRALLATDSIYDDLMNDMEARSERHTATLAAGATAAAASVALAAVAPLPIEDVASNFQPPAARFAGGNGGSAASPLVPFSTASLALTSILHSASAIAASTVAQPAAAALAAPSTQSTVSAHSLPNALSSSAAPTAPGGLRGSRMSAEQVRANREKAEKKTKENAELKAKQNHYIERFTTQFPAPKPISTTMQCAKSVEGPMALLRSFHARRMRVYVSIRASHSVRSILRGLLVCFDKHWNMVLLDVEEAYTEWEWHKYGKHTRDKLREQGARFQIPRESRRAVEEIDRQAVAASSSSSHGHPTASAAAAPLIRIETFKTRHLHQLYVRGDSIIAVTQNKPTLIRPPMEEESARPQPRATAAASAAAASPALV